MGTGISIVVPVGPQPEYKKYISECLISIQKQLNYRAGDEIILVDDMAHLSYDDTQMAGVVLQRNSWLLGCAASWNIGVGTAENDLVLLMGSDDVLLPGALDALRESYEANNGKAAWYNLTIQIDEGPDTGIHTVFNNAAAVTKKLWNMTGGFPPSAFAAPDALMISIMLVHMPDRLIQVKEGTPLYRCRVHDAQDTQRMAAPLSWEVIQIRNLETQRWKEPTWTK